MRTMAFYISDYGYGHASRSIALVRELVRQDEHLKIIVCHSYAWNFLHQSLQHPNIIFRKIQTDIGYVLKENSMMPDSIKMENKLESFIEDWELKVERERDFLFEHKVNLVISDISPLPFLPAKKLGVPSIGISNFTWSTAYQSLVKNTLCREFNEAYSSMNAFFSLAGSNEPEWTMDKKEYGLYARETNSEEVERISHLLNPNQDKKIVFVGLGMKLETGFMENMPLWDSTYCMFVVSSNVEVKGKESVYTIPGDYLETQNFIAASDLVITKAGWGTVSEAVIANVPLLILARDSMKEDQNTLEFLQSNHLCQIIQWSDFLQLKLNKEIIEDSTKQDGKKNFINEVTYISRDILTYIKK